jgi:hypothetical protein
VQRHGKSYKLIPIDHGYSFPSYLDLSEVHFEWFWWKQCDQPFSPAVLDYISKLDPLADAVLLRNMVGIRDESLLSTIVSSFLLQRAAAQGLTLRQIANLVQRSHDNCPSVLENIINHLKGQYAEQLTTSDRLHFPALITDEQLVSNSIVLINDDDPASPRHSPALSHLTISIASPSSSSSSSTSPMSAFSVVDSPPILALSADLNDAFSISATTSHTASFRPQQFSFGNSPQCEEEELPLAPDSPPLAPVTSPSPRSSFSINPRLQVVFECALSIIEQEIAKFKSLTNTFASTIAPHISVT